MSAHFFLLMLEGGFNLQAQLSSFRCWREDSIYTHKLHSMKLSYLKHTLLNQLQYEWKYHSIRERCCRRLISHFWWFLQVHQAYLSRKQALHSSDNVLEGIVEELFKPLVIWKICPLTNDFQSSFQMCYRKQLVSDCASDLASDRCSRNPSSFADFRPLDLNFNPSIL